jgi:hypothetical protein
MYRCYRSRLAEVPMVRGVVVGGGEVRSHSRRSSGVLARANIRRYVKRLLRKLRHPPDLQDAAVQNVLQQAEALSAEMGNVMWYSQTAIADRGDRPGGIRPRQRQLSDRNRLVPPPRQRLHHHVGGLPDPTGREVEDVRERLERGERTADRHQGAIPNTQSNSFGANVAAVRVYRTREAI